MGWADREDRGSNKRVKEPEKSASSRKREKVLEGGLSSLSVEYSKGFLGSQKIESCYLVTIPNADVNLRDLCFHKIFLG